MCSLVSHFYPILTKSCHDTGSDLIDDDDEDDNYVWLLNNYSPVSLVQTKWEETYLRRMRIKSNLKKAFEYMNRFPALATANGWELVSYFNA